MAPSDDGSSDGQAGRPAEDGSMRQRRRSLRAVLAADIAGFSGRMSLNETNTINALSEIRVVGRRELEKYNGWLFGMPGDGLFATFESAVDAVQCALEIQLDLNNRPHLGEMPLRIGIHLGEVIIDNDLPYGETLNIAARLESLADPGGILVSGTVMDAVSARVSATFEERGVPILKNIPRRIPTFAVKPPPARSRIDETQSGLSSLDRTTRLDRDALKQILSSQPVDDRAGEPVLTSQETSVPPASSVTDDQRNSEAQPKSLAEKLAELPVPSVPEYSEGPAPESPRDLDTAAQPAVPFEKTLPDLQSVAGAFSEPDALSQVAGDEPSKDFIDQIIKALAVHVGPFSKLIVEREMQANPAVFELIAKLEAHIPNENERSDFRASASQISAATRQTGSDDI